MSLDINKTTVFINLIYKMIRFNINYNSNKEFHILEDNKIYKEMV